MITIDLNNQSENILPIRLRSVESLALMRVFNSHLNSVLIAFYYHHHNLIYNMSFTGQVIYFEHLLNDLFDPINRAIHIEDYEFNQKQYVFNRSEDNESLLVYNASEDESPVLLTNKQEESNSFIIYVPSGQITNFQQFKSIVDIYKLKSKEYIIIEE